MEATAEDFARLKVAICPPKLEDAGLEDCALPPEAIKEAFLKAASYAKSRIFADEDEEEADGCCVEDPAPSNGEAPDALVGTDELPTNPLCGCIREKGNFPPGEERGLVDDVVVVGPGEDIEGDTPSDKVVVLGGEEEAAGSDKKACVGEDVQKGDKEKKKKNRGEEEDGGSEEKKLILAEVLI